VFAICRQFSYCSHWTWTFQICSIFDIHIFRPNRYQIFPTMKQAKERPKRVANDLSGPPPVKRVPAFEYPSLPRWETVYYYLFGVGIFVYAWYRVYAASREYKWDGWYGMYENTPYSPVLGPGWKKDVTNFEWRKWVPYAKSALPWFLGHSLLFNFLSLILKKNVWSIVMFIYWLIANIYIFDSILLAASMTSGFLVYCTMRLTRWRTLVWAISVIFLYLSLNHVDFFHRPRCYYIGVMFLSYKMLQYISFNLEECTNGRVENENFFQGLYHMFWYAFYLPYSSSLIVIYKRFPEEMKQRFIKKRRSSEILWFAARIVFWYFFIDHFFLYVMYHDALILDRDVLSSVSEDTLVSIAYATGQFFQMKYVVIFGLPAIFAKLDNMSPLKGPICIARVSLYSKIWRSFDRGLYQFFKEYIFLPICRPTFSLWRVVSGVFVSYGFVLVWHGLTHQYIVWIILNISELFVEQLAKRFYSIPTVNQWRKKKFRDQVFRRILAVLQITPLAFGLYAIFYFLADSNSGYIIVDRIFWQETVNLRWPFFLLLFVGYHFNQMCMDVEKTQCEAEKRQVEEEEKLKAKKIK
uniref:Protein-cysteine N-palmitoyltransferase Rasp n=1 Tax=Romanomermis culicivorax TaxID=13658 RepID=A0A915IYG1_ROMCU